MKFFIFDRCKRVRAIVRSTLNICIKKKKSLCPFRWTFSCAHICIDTKIHKILMATLRTFVSSNHSDKNMCERMRLKEKNVQTVEYQVQWILILTL